MTDTHVMTTPIGPLTIVVEQGAVRAIRFADQGRAVLRDEDGTITVDPARPTDPVLADAVHQLREYFAGERTAFEVPCEPAGTEFQRRAWRALIDVPYGHTTTYGAQATRLGNPNAVRAVGAANGANPIPIIIPCHRIVGADGRLTGFGGGLPAKAWLLDHEQRVSGQRLPW